MSALQNEVAARAGTAREIAAEAGRLTLRYFQREIEVDRKDDNSPVTIADRQAETLLRERIEASFPDDAIFGEEFPEKSGNSEFRWILDPIDGTKSFISGVPLYGTLVAVEHNGKNVAGVILIPALGECVFAAEGKGAWYTKGDADPVPARVSSAKTLAEGLFVTSQIDSFVGRGAMSAYHALEQAAGITRTWGDCYGYLLVATGRAVAMVDPIVNAWDVAAVEPILREAGGTFTDWKGNSGDFIGEGVGTNGHVLPEVLEKLHE